MRVGAATIHAHTAGDALLTVSSGLFEPIAEPARTNQVREVVEHARLGATLSPISAMIGALSEVLAAQEPKQADAAVPLERLAGTLLGDSQPRSPRC